MPGKGKDANEDMELHSSNCMGHLSPLVEIQFHELLYKDRLSLQEHF